MKKRNDITTRDKILAILKKPHTLTEIKKELPLEKSYGNIHYHLKELEKESILTAEVNKNRRGRPVTYTIKDEAIKKKYDEMLEMFEKWEFEFLKYLEKNNGVSEEIVEEDLGDIGDVPSNVVEKGYVEIHYHLTEKGKRHLKKQSKK